MIIGTGIDIIEIWRVAKAIGNRHFVDRVYTAAERDYCEQRGRQAAASFAARFAGKEAVLKAFGTGLSGGSLQDVGIVTDARGCPHVQLAGFYAALAADMGITTIHISLTHAQKYAAAYVVFEGGIS